MSSFVPNRSARGCLTCKQRRKKCDETKPICQRCTQGGFPCRGYNHLDTLGASTSRRKTKEEHTVERTHNPSSWTALDKAVQLRPTISHPQPTTFAVSLTKSRDSYINGSFGTGHHREWHDKKSQTLCAPPSTPDDIVDFIVSRYLMFMHRIFCPFRFPIEQGLARVIRESSLTRWSMYIGAKIIHNLSNGIEMDNCRGLVRRLHWQTISNPAGDSIEIRLMCCQNLAIYTLLASGVGWGYSLFRQSSSLFLELIEQSADPHFQKSTISLHGALCSPSYEICRFAAFDTILSLALAVPPLIRYDITNRVTPTTISNIQIMQSVYGWPVDILLSLGTVNAWRVSRWMGQTEENPLEWQEVQQQIERWRPSLEYIDEPSNVIGRFAVYESWRQAALIYLYMGMCMVNSADPRVEAAVRQVVQLAGTIEAGAVLERHIFMPCLIAGAAARQEKHRALLRDKLFSARGDNVWIISGPDVVSVLDHLWHGAGAGGAPTTWEDYVVSRCEALPFGDGTDMY